MSDDLQISGSNSSAVATDELLGASEQFAAMTTEASLLGRSLSILEREAVSSSLGRPCQKPLCSQTGRRAATAVVGPGPSDFRGKVARIVCARRGTGKAGKAPRAARTGGRTALFRRPYRRRNRCGPGCFSPDREVGLAICEGLAPARAWPGHIAPPKRSTTLPLERIPLQVRGIFAWGRQICQAP